MPDTARWLENTCILVVEDDALIALGLVCYLEELGGTVVWASTVAEAIRSIDPASRPDLAIVDLNLDGERSTSVLNRLLDLDVSIILCTGYEASSIEERFRGLPRSEKPFTRHKIRHLIAAVL